MNILEQLWGAILKGPLFNDLSAPTPMAGFGTINSGSAVTSITNANVRSGDLIFVQEYLTGSLGIGVSSGGPLVVSAISDGVSFDVANAKGAAVDWDRGFAWWIIKTSDQP